MMMVVATIGMICYKLRQTYNTLVTTVTYKINIIIQYNVRQINDHNTYKHIIVPCIV